MPEFHETIYGRRFFDSQLPELIRNLGRIADAMEKQQKVTEHDIRIRAMDELIDALCDSNFSANNITDEVVNFMYDFKIKSNPV